MLVPSVSNCFMPLARWEKDRFFLIKYSERSQGKVQPFILYYFCTKVDFIRPNFLYHN
jgi:hypothetical protein